MMNSHKYYTKFVLTLVISTLPFLGFSPYVKAEELKITGNGSDSDNNISITQDTHTEVEQSNNANIDNNIQQKADTGNNTASDNSGDTSIDTGDIDTATKVENQANISAVDVNNCCNNNSTEATISGNGSGSDNNIDINKSNDTTIDIKQNANINNDVDVKANTGDNKANDNTGDVSINTGDISGKVEVKNANINIDPVDVNSCCEDMSIKIADNGSDSDNSIKVNEENNIEIRLDNRAEVNNDVNIDANTGGNEADDNSGDVNIQTGDIDFEALVENGPINIKLVNIGEEEAIIKPTEQPEEQEEEEEKAPSQPAAQPPAVSQVSAAEVSSQPTGAVLAAAAEAPEVLPISGNNIILYLTLMSILMFLLGLYLRLHPGRDPSIKRIKL